jgi:hypothetical protein
MKSIKYVQGWSIFCGVLTLLSHDWLFLSEAQQPKAQSSVQHSCFVF